MSNHMISQKENKNIKKYNFIFLIIAVSLFAILIESQRQKLYPANKLKELENNDKIVYLKNWRIEFESCDPNALRNCISPDGKTHELSFPAAEEITSITKKIKSETGLEVNKAYMQIDLDFSTKAWVRSTRAPVNLVIPVFSASHVMVKHPPNLGNVVHTAYAHDLVVNIPKSSLNDGIIRLEVYFLPNTKWFGPALYPPALATWKATKEYANIDQLTETTMHLARLVEVLLPLLIVAMALIIDHSKGLMFLGFFAVSTAARTVVAMYARSELTEPMYQSLAFLYGLSFFLLIRLALQLCELNLKKWYSIFLALLSGLVTYTIYVMDDSQQVIRSMDLWVDSAAAGTSLIIIAYTAFQFATNRKQIISDQINASKKLKFIVLFSASIFLFISFIANTMDLHNYYTTGTKDFLNWTHRTLVPGLLFTVFLDIGSVVNTIRNVSAIVREKTKIDRDLEISKELQSGILPDKKSTGNGWSWHAFYFPAAHLAGDWFDLREVEFKCGTKALVSTVVDVTGHGISSAMMTSNIASHWSLWCDAIAEVDYPHDQRDLDELISSAPSQIHRGLIGLRYNLGCSLAVVMFEPESKNLTYLTAGHPGIILGSESKFEYLTTTGTRPGIKTEHSAWDVGNKTLEPTVDQIILYTDGIVELNKSVPVWLKHVRRDANKTKKTITSYFTSQLRKNRRLFLNDPNKEDDLTLLIIKIT